MQKHLLSVSWILSVAFTVVMISLWETHFNFRFTITVLSELDAQKSVLLFPSLFSIIILSVLPWTTSMDIDALQQLVRMVMNKNVRMNKNDTILLNLKKKKKLSVFYWNKLPWFNLVVWKVWVTYCVNPEAVARMCSAKKVFYKTAVFGVSF